jgi:hypothetical protein
MLSFKDFIVVDYKPGEHELVKYAAHKRHRGRIGEETTDEALDFSQRRARARSMKKNKAKIAMGQRRAKNKPANQERLKKRAARQARMDMFKKLAKDTPKDEVGAARRQGIEKRLDKLKPRIDKIARKLLPQIRKTEKERRQRKSGTE